jgi:hypothetical protein
MMQSICGILIGSDQVTLGASVQPYYSISIFHMLLGTDVAISSQSHWPKVSAISVTIVTKE